MLENMAMECIEIKFTATWNTKKKKKKNEELVTCVCVSDFAQAKDESFSLLFPSLQCIVHAMSSYS